MTKRSVEIADLIVIYEMAELAGVAVQTINAWQNRYRDFPLPIVRFHMGPIYSRTSFLGWLWINRPERVPPQI